MFIIDIEVIFNTLLEAFVTVLYKPVKFNVQYE